MSRLSAAADRNKLILKLVSEQIRDLNSIHNHDSIFRNMTDRDFWLVMKALGIGAINLSGIAVKRGPKIVSDFNRYPWLKSFLRFPNFFQALKGRSGRYREAILSIATNTATMASNYFGNILTNPDKVVGTQMVIIPELTEAMGLVPVANEALPILGNLILPNCSELYIDHAENGGVDPSICSLIKSSLGTIIAGEFPECTAFIESTQCEGSLGAQSIIERHLNVPTFRLDTPNRKDEKAERFLVEELKRLIKWLEENTCGKMDWDRLKEVCEERNRSVEYEMELWEMIQARPSPMSAEVIWLSHLIGFALGGGTKETTKIFKDLRDLCKKNYDEGVSAVPNEKYRAILWHPPMTHLWTEFYRWCEQKYGISFLMDSMTYNTISLIDTSSRETILRGLAQLILHAPMVRHVRGDGEKYLSDLAGAIDRFEIDVVFVADHVGCKAASGMSGMVKDMLREKKIPGCFIQYDLMDPRFVSGDKILDSVNIFMETVMGE